MPRSHVVGSLLLVTWLVSGCRGNVGNQTAQGSGPVRADAGNVAAATSTKPSAENVLTASSAALAATGAAALVVPKDQATRLQPIADAAARVTENEFPSCSANTRRSTRRTHDGRVTVSCVRGLDARLRLHGPSWHWFDRDRLSETEYYQAGLKHGPTIRWYAHGVRRTEGEFALGERHGTWHEYHPNGVLAEDARYEHGHRQGVRRRFFESGRKSLEATYEGGVAAGLWSAFYDNEASQLALTVPMKAGLQDGQHAGFSPDGTPWTRSLALSSCVESKNCSSQLERLDIESLPPVPAARCSYEDAQTVPRNRWGPLLKAARSALSPNAPNDAEPVTPVGCVEGIKISCAPDLDGVDGAEVLAEILYRLDAPDCAFARRQKISQTCAFVALSPPPVGSGAWRSLGLIGYRSFYSVGVESPFPTSIVGFVSLPNGGTGVRTCESLNDDEGCYRVGTELLLVSISGRFLPLVSHSIPE